MTGWGWLLTGVVWGLLLCIALAIAMVLGTLFVNVVVLLWRRRRRS
jgi:hypothetical protein